MPEPRQLPEEGWASCPHPTPTAACTLSTAPSSWIWRRVARVVLTVRANLQMENRVERALS